MLRFAPAGDGDSSSDDNSFVFGDEDAIQNEHSTDKNSVISVSGLQNNSNLPSNKSHKNHLVEKEEDELFLLTDLQNAVINGNKDTVDSVLNRKPSLCNVLLGSGWTALMYAANFGNLDLVNLILVAGADVNQKSSTGCTALIAACKSTSNSSTVCTIVQYLLDSAADVAAQDDSGKTALFYSTRNGKTHLLQLLLQQPKNNVNVKDKRGWTALDWAISRNSVLAVEYLLVNGANVFSQSSHEAMSDNVKEHLVKSGILIEESFFTLPLSNAEYSDHNRSGDAMDMLKVVYSGPCKAPISVSENNVMNIRCAQDDVENTYQRYGQLELLLCGLDIPHLIPHFHEHDVQFEQLLSFELEDLTALGIKQHGSKLKILKAIKDWHCTEWTDDSMPKSMNTNLSFKNIQAVLRTSVEHLQCIASSMRFVGKQLHVHPQVLEPPADTHFTNSPYNIVGDQTDKLLLSAHELCSSLKLLRLEVSALSELRNCKLQFRPADQIRQDRHSHGRNTRRLIVLAASLLALGWTFRKLVCWNKLANGVEGLHKLASRCVQTSFQHSWKLAIKQ